MEIKVLVFGAARELVGSGAVAVVIDKPVSSAVLVGQLRSAYPALAKLSSFAIAVNGAYASPDTIVGPGDEVAIIPPVSGG